MNPSINGPIASTTCATGRGLTKGMQVESATYGHEATVLRLNARTVSLRFASGFEDRQPYYDVLRIVSEQPNVA